MGGTCKLMKQLMDIDGVINLPYESIESIKSIICGTHNGVCSERFSGIKSTSESSGLFESEYESLSGLFPNKQKSLSGLFPDGSFVND